MSNKKRISALIFSLLLSILICSCKPNLPVDQTDISQPSDEQTTSIQNRKLTVCLGYSPESLFFYKATTQVEWDILQAMYDLPTITSDGETFPTILKGIPSHENGGLEITSTALIEGDMLVDTSGNTVPLEKGVQFFPSGCSTLDCAKKWDGTESVLVDKVKLSFQLLDDLKWSDGTPLTAQDSVFSYVLASDPLTPIDKTLIRQIADYKAIDQSTLSVSLFPGVISQNPLPYFFNPLPLHAWGDYSVAEILQAPFANETPLSWGAYRIKEWGTDSIYLERNPYYYRAAEGLPAFEELEFRFTSVQGDTNLATLDFDYAPYEIFEYNWSPDGSTHYMDQCDVVDSTVDFSDQYDMFDYLLDYYITPAILVNNPSNEILEGLWLNPQKGWVTDLQPILSQCIDRSYLNSKLNYGIALPTESIYTVSYDAANNLYAPDEAAQALETLGWHDDDGDPGTARVSNEVESIQNGTALTLSLPILNDPFYEREAELLQLSLQDCGIQLDIQPYQAADYYQMENTPIYKDYDVRLVTQRITAEFPCTMVATEAGNFTFPGISKDEKISSQCSGSSNLEIPETSIPLIPLFYHVDISIARSDLCGLSPSGQPSSDLWNIEEFDYGETCSAGIKN